jgi:ATP-dependent DNA helicase RecG
MNETEILEAVSTGESADWEFKSAKGGFPANVWETYSAMANTDGGTIVLGIGERDDGFHVEGLKNPNATLKTCWDALNNRGVVSLNLLSDSDARLTLLDGKQVLAIRVPRAGRRQRPVFVGQNPLQGTYRRNYEGDYKCPAEEVGRMLADQAHEPADSRILPNFSVSDLDAESIRQYRNRFSARNPNHVWLNEETIGFLQKLGGWLKNRATGEEGLTVAGLLMFGNEDGLIDAASGLKYHLDYRERPSNAIADRWTDRLTPDGTWVPNLFQFFQKVYPKLTNGLKLPFAYLSNPPDLFTDPIRASQSPVHEAIQEAFVNALIHADYRGIGGVVIERFSDRIELSNPGTLLVSIDQLRQGAISECRNPSLQRMFHMIGAGDKAGSGIDKIRRGWQTQQWRLPTVTETTQPDRVKFVLPMVSLLPPESEARLRKIFAQDYASLSAIEVQALVTADLEGEVSNSRLQLIREEHPVELTKMLQGLVAKGFLDQVGQKRGCSYRLPAWGLSVNSGTSPLAPEASPLAPEASPLAPEASPLALGASPLALGASPLAPEASPLAPELDPILIEIAKLAREKKKLAPELTKRIIRRLCSNQFLTAEQIGNLMDRRKDKLQESFLANMVHENQLHLRFPEQPTHPEQAYRTSPDCKNQ